MDLCVILLTNRLKKKILPPKYQPKVCYQLGDKSILELCLDQWVKLNPKRIILMVSKNEIQQINRIVKYLPYAKSLSYCIFDRLEPPRLSLGRNCYDGYNVLVVPGNAPLLTSESLFKQIQKGQSFRVNPQIFFLNKDDLGLIDNPEQIPEIVIPEADTEMLETQGQYDRMIVRFKKKSSWSQKMWAKLKRKND